MPSSAGWPSPCHCFNFRSVARILTHFYDQELEPTGLLITQYSLLSHVARLGPLSMNSLSEAMGLERTTLLRNLHLLAKRNFVDMEHADGRKAKFVRIRPEGTAALEAARPSWTAAQNKLKSLLSEEERSMLPGIMDKLRTLCP